MANLNYQYSKDLRFRIWLLRELKIDVKEKIKRGETVSELWDIEMRSLRCELRKAAQLPDYTVMYRYDKECDEYDPDDCCVIYKEPFKFKGTKQEFNAYLWQNHASKIYSDYDCTGKWFTRFYKIGNMGNDLWKVAEYMGRDV